MQFTSGLTSTNSLIAQILSKVYRLDMQSPPEEPIGETSSREHFNDFIGILLLLTIKMYMHQTLVCIIA